MAKNVAARRAAKAQRRKVIVAQKRQVENLGKSVSGQVRAAAAEPIQHCLVSEGLFRTGMGMLVLARGPSPTGVTAAVFLLDTFALGPKDVFLRSFGGFEFDNFMDQISRATPMVPLDPSHARKLLRDLVAWSRDAGFNPHPDYAKIEAIFGSVDPAACDTAFEFGHGGRPLLISNFGGPMFGDGYDDLAIDADDDFDSSEAEADAPAAIAAADAPGRDDDRAAA
nr:hypothetical protein [uncultured Rhodopila sp.]